MMRFIRFSILFMLFTGCFGLFTACKNDSAAQKTGPSVPSTSREVNAGFYKHFRGTIGTSPVTMDLVKTTTPYNEEPLPHLSGFYSYDKYEQPIPVYGSIDASGAVQITESDADGTGAIFTGKLDANGSFSGTWADTTKNLKQDFRLQEVTDSSIVSFDIFPFSDSMKLLPNVVKSPKADFTMDALMPAKNTEGGLFEFLRQQIIMDLRGDTVVGNYAKLQMSDVQQTARDSFFAHYKADMADMKIDTTDEPFSMSYTIATNIDIVSNVNGLLTLAFKEYSYTGGAHGNHGTRLRTYNIKNKKVVTLDDLFKPNYKSALNAAIVRSAKRHFNVPPKGSLKDRIFHDNVEANDNFMVNGKGILFNYVPYEIASYADGEIQLFVSFEELKGILK